MNIQVAREKIIEKIKQTEEEWVLLSILKLLDIDEYSPELETEEWRQGASSALSRAYGEDEPNYKENA